MSNKEDFMNQPETNLTYIQAMSRNKKVIVFNGPPSSGKDAACEFLTSHKNIVHITFKRKLIALTQTIFGVGEEWWDERYTTIGKNEPRVELGGRSQRDALIFVSEQVIKPNLGNDYFGRATLIDIAKEIDNNFVVVSDCGFIEEIITLSESDLIDSEDIMIVRVHRSGYDFSKDSRSYVDAEKYGIVVVDIANDSTLEEYLNKISYCFPRLCSSIVDWDVFGTPIFQNECFYSFEAFNEAMNSKVLPLSAFK